ncbi:MAG: hypothetical protein KDB74_01365 [Flavobacteriales bacterium]|nr:hypothetical protein [Flavobacteriales bacterium]
MERIYHPYYLWECYKAGFFSPSNNRKKEEEYNKYVTLLTNLPLFEKILNKVITEWKYSCEHNLTNESLNRIAWLGQASCAYLFGCNAANTRVAFNLLTENQQKEANAMAEKYLNKWMENYKNECIKKTAK